MRTLWIVLMVASLATAADARQPSEAYCSDRADRLHAMSSNALDSALSIAKGALAARDQILESDVRVSEVSMSAMISSADSLAKALSEFSNALKKLEYEIRVCEPWQ